MSEEKKDLNKKEMPEEELNKVSGGASPIYTTFHIEAYYYSAYISPATYDPDIKDLANNEVAVTSDLGLKIGDILDNINRKKVKRILDSAPKGSGIYTKAISAYKLNTKIDFIIKRITG